MSVILILTYGKVCSTSLQVLLEPVFPGNVRSTHRLRNWPTWPVGDLRALPGYFRPDDELRSEIDAAVSGGQEVTIITGVRDPVMRSLSVAMQTLDFLFPQCIADEPGITASRLLNELCRLWAHEGAEIDPLQRLRLEVVRAPLVWFKHEIEEPFGFDLCGQPFPQESGYQLYRLGKVRLMVFQMEKAPLAVEQGLSELFPGYDFSLPRENASDNKPRRDTYALLQADFRLPTAALGRIYRNKYVRHFMAHSEAEAMIGRWSSAERAVPEPPVFPQLRLNGSYRGAVVISVRNHAAWIGVQLASLFEQWRPDLELVVIDDASTDRSFEAVRDALATRPTIPATLLRNPSRLGLGVIPIVLQATASELIIQADSDDICLPGRLDLLLSRFEEDPSCRLVTSNAVLMSDEGLPVGLYDGQHGDTIFVDPLQAASIDLSSRWLGATAAFHRSVLEDFPIIDPDLCPIGLDLLIPFRAALLGAHHYLATPMVGYRLHSQNSHRVAGGYAGETPRGDQFRILVAMALAQKIRDAQWARARLPIPEDFDAIVTACQDLFFARFADWTRLHNRLQQRESGRTDAGNEHYRAPIPPIVSLDSGQQYRFGRHDLLGTAAANWDGFHQPESAWTWTGRNAVLVIRVMSQPVQRVVLALSGLALEPAARVRVSVDFGPWVEVILGTEAVTIELSPGVPASIGYMTLLVDAPHACAPADVMVGNSDGRVLGACMHWLMLH